MANNNRITGFEINRIELVRENEFMYESYGLTKESATIRSVSDVYAVIKAMGFERYPDEVLGMFCTNTKGEIIAYHEISHGSLNSSVCTPREAFKRAIVNNAGGVIFVHNHPSGDSTPSTEDKNTTKRLVEAGELLGVRVLDHIVVGDGEYTSMKVENLI